MISDTKVSKITQKPLFYKAFTVWELAQAGSTPVIPTKNRGFDRKIEAVAKNIKCHTITSFRFFDVFYIIS